MFALSFRRWNDLITTIMNATKKQTEKNSIIASAVNNASETNESKELSILFFQDGCSYQFNREVDIFGLNIYVGTALNRLFDYTDVCKTVGAKSFKFSSPIQLEITVKHGNGTIETFGTKTVSKNLVDKLKLQRNTEGKKRFGKRIYSLCQFALKDIKVVSFEEVIASLE